jgi:hypothetical protein
MNTELDIEVTLDELDQVTGGLSDQTRTTILNALTALPVIGVVAGVGRTFGNAWRAAVGQPPV